MKQVIPEDRIAHLFRNLGQPERVRILLAIGDGEACVCHLEAALGLRQAYISQHLMSLREARILTARRDGRFIFYRLANPALLALIQEAGRLAGLRAAELEKAMLGLHNAVCECPNCGEIGSRTVSGGASLSASQALIEVS
jgi:ArsR family transcriptional regulator